MRTDDATDDPYDEWMEDDRGTPPPGDPFDAMDEWPDAWLDDVPYLNPDDFLDEDYGSDGLEAHYADLDPWDDEEFD
jgi:hypothetical protein